MKMTLFLAACLVAAALLSTAVRAAAVPQPSRYDSHMQQVSYNGQNSTVIHTQAVYLSTSTTRR